jgi:diguanylate cyclase
VSRQQTAWKWAATGGLVATAGYFVLPSPTSQNIAYVLFGLASVAAIAWALRIHKPFDRMGWYLLLAGNLCSVIGDAIENIGYNLLLHRPIPFPSVADAFYLAAYPFLFAGIARLCRSPAQGGSRENYADAAILSVGALALSWHFLMGSYLHDDTVSAFGRLVIMAYPVMDLGILFILIRSLLFGGARLPFQKVLALSMASMLTADFTYDILVLHGGYAIGDPVDAGWLLNYVLVGVAALHPSMARPRVEGGDHFEARRRIPLLALAGFIAPGILLVGSLTGAAVDVPVIAGTSIVLFLLISVRMSWLFDRVQAQSVQARADTAALAEALRARESLEFDLRHQAFHDSLTGLANRSLLHDRIEHALAAANRSEGLVAICLCDLDGFKMVNDSLGHQYGDHLLTVAGKRLRSIVRRADTVARLGGDEFAVLMDAAESKEAAAEVAERIVDVLREPVEIDGHQLGMSASVGLAFGQPGKTPEQLLSEADTAMYEAKAKGKARWEVFEPCMHVRSRERLDLVNAFRGSLQRSEFFLEYQPQFGLSDGELVGFEALLRWDHPTLGRVEPDQFVPLAEETGFIVPLGRWVLETACDQVMSWTSRRGASVSMAVNLSPRQIQDRNLGDDIRTTLAMTGLPAHRLVLEVTESTLLDDTEETTAMLAQLNALGVKLALDDFGTGYSSLAYLRRYPLDILKIDKSFVEALGDPGDQATALTATIIQFARTLGLHTVAEGIEHQAQHRALAGLGCDTGQGRLLSDPLGQDQAAALVAGSTPAMRRVVPSAGGPGVDARVDMAMDLPPTATHAPGIL